MPFKDQIPKASLAAINKGDANTQINSGILGRDSPNLRELGQDVKVKLADLQANLNNPFFSSKLFKELQLYFSFLHPSSIQAYTNISI